MNGTNLSKLQTAKGFLVFQQIAQGGSDPYIRGHRGEPFDDGRFVRRA